MEDKDEISILSISAPEIIYQQDKAHIDMQIATAKQYPRNLKKCVEEAVFGATFDKESAESCGYSVPRGDGYITGPSVHLANIMAQSWGNMRISTKVVSVDATTVTSEAVCFDLEKNLAVQVQVKRTILDRFKKRFKEDMIIVTGNAANSIARRNAILAVIPEVYSRKVYRESISKITGDLSNETKLQNKRKEVISRMMDSYSATEKEILNLVKRSIVDHVTAEDIATLISIGQAIKGGDTDVDTVFKRKPEPEKVDKDRERIVIMAEDLTGKEAQLLTLKEDTLNKYPGLYPDLIEMIDLKIKEASEPKM